MGPIIGIDFGTTNSVVCEWREGRARVVPNALGEAVTPSVVTIGPDGAPLFGRPAREALAPGRTVRSIKRVLGVPADGGAVLTDIATAETAEDVAAEKAEIEALERGEAKPASTVPAAQVELAGERWRPETLAAALFRHLKRDAEARVHAAVDAAVITVPANSKGLQRTATKVAAQMAGIRPLTLINEPTAAAMAYGVSLAGERTLLVYDFGGGTFDVTILRVHHGLFEELASKGVRLLGGDDIDRALVERVIATTPGVDAAALADPAHVYWAQRLALACEEAKIALSERDEAMIRVPGFLGRMHLERAVTRAELEELARPLVARTGEALEAALAAAGLAREALDQVLLVGGTSKMPLVRAHVEGWLGRPVAATPGVDPLTCVAEGAAIAAGIIAQAPDLADRDYVVRLEHSLCIKALAPDHDRMLLSPVIGRGAAIPTTDSRTYWPSEDFTDWIALDLYEGDVFDRPRHPDNARLLTMRIPIEPPRPTEDAEMRVTLRYGEDGILAAEVEDVHEGKVLTREAVGFPQAMLDEAAQATEAARLDAWFPAAPTWAAAAPLGAASGAPGAGPAAGPAPEAALLAEAQALAARLPAPDDAEATAFRAAIAALAAALGPDGTPGALERAAHDVREGLVTFAWARG